MDTDAHNVGREERRALLEQRRAAVVRQLRRLAIELTDIDDSLTRSSSRSVDKMRSGVLHAGWHPNVR